MRAITGAAPGRARPGQRPLPADRPARRQRGDGRQHPRAASRADAAPDAGARHGAVHPGRHPAELHPGAARRRDWGPSARTRRGRWRAGLELHTTLAVNPDGVALGVLRAAFDAPAPPNPEAEGKPSAKPREERKSFRWGRGVARLHAGGRAIVRNPRGVRDGPRGRFPRPVRRAPRGLPSRSTCWSARRPTRVLGKEKDARRADGLTPSVRYGAQRAGPRRRKGRGAAAERASQKASKQARKDRREARVADVTLRYQQVGPAVPRCRRRSNCGSSTCARNSRRPRPHRWSGSC